MKFAILSLGFLLTQAAYAGDAEQSSLCANLLASEKNAREVALHHFRKGNQYAYKFYEKMEIKLRELVKDSECDGRSAPADLNDRGIQCKELIGRERALSSELEREAMENIGNSASYERQGLKLQSLRDLRRELKIWGCDR